MGRERRRPALRALRQERPVREAVDQLEGQIRDSAQRQLSAAREHAPRRQREASLLFSEREPERLGRRAFEQLAHPSAPPGRGAGFWPFCSGSPKPRPTLNPRYFAASNRGDFAAPWHRIHMVPVPRPPILPAPASLTHPP